MYSEYNFLNEKDIIEKKIRVSAFYNDTRTITR